MDIQTKQLKYLRISDGLEELTQHGPLSFPLTFYETQPSLNGLGMITLHWHEEFQFSIVTHGCIEFQCSNAAYRLHEGEGLLINSNRLHSCFAVAPADSQYLCLAFHPRMVRTFEGSAVDTQFVQPFIDSPLSVLPFTDHSPWSNGILEQVFHLYRLYLEQSAGYQLLIMSELLAIWQKLITSCSSQLCQSKRIESIDHQRIKSIMSFIYAHYSEDISLTDIAGSIGLSKGECCRLFKKITNTTLFGYLQLYRIKRSLVLLETTDLSVGEIAAQTGFNSFSYFSACFKKTVGTTPKDYRQKL